MLIIPSTTNNDWLTHPLTLRQPENSGQNAGVMDIRLVALDMDGTLLSTERQLAAQTIQALQDAQNAGITVCLASGRAISTILPFAKQAGILGPIVSCNGGYVVDAERNTIRRDGLSPQVSELLIDYAASNGVHANFYSCPDIHFSSMSTHGKEYVRRARHISPIITSYTEMSGMTATKILFMDDPDRVQEHKAALTDLLQDEQAEIILSEPEYIEFLPKGINKGDGAAAVAAHLGLKTEQTAALGDYWNDLEMIQWAGFSGAVANGVDGVREAADVVVASNDDLGAVEFLRLLR